VGVIDVLSMAVCVSTSFGALCVFLCLLDNKVSRILEFETKFRLFMTLSLLRLGEGYFLLLSVKI
jgi:hypothetical protein